MVPEGAVKWKKNIKKSRETSPLKATYHETLIYHFSIVEQCIKRMAFHGSKINVPKCDFAKSKILFLGWYVSHDFVIADPRRVQKVKDFK